MFKHYLGYYNFFGVFAGYVMKSHYEVAHYLYEHYVTK